MCFSFDKYLRNYASMKSFINDWVIAFDEIIETGDAVLIDYVY